jgi:hypothetical protein
MLIAILTGTAAMNFWASTMLEDVVALGPRQVAGDDGEARQGDDSPSVPSNGRSRPSHAWLTGEAVRFANWAQYEPHVTFGHPKSGDVEEPIIRKKYPVLCSGGAGCDADAGRIESYSTKCVGPKSLSQSFRFHAWVSYILHDFPNQFSTVISTSIIKLPLHVWQP